MSYEKPLNQLSRKGSSNMPPFTLRPYQKQALDAVLDAARKERYLLLQAATGAGKTILFSALVKELMTRYQMRIGILAHREILVRQAYEKLLKVWPGGVNQIGIACAGASSRVNINAPVVIASPQTLIKRLGSMPPLNLLIIDEVHRLSPQSEPSQYRTLIRAMESYDPKLRVLGVTATPYRLGHGFIHGDQCGPGRANWFSGLTSQISIQELVSEGYLSPYRAKQAVDMAGELKGVRTSGDYVLKELGALMTKQVHIAGAVRAYEDHARDRRQVVIFCVNIEHAELVAKAFTKAGYPCATVHSKMPMAKRRMVLSDFDHGRLNFVANVGVLTEGWDSTGVDCLILCRPTKSAALYVQMVGRGLRTHPGKKDALILDLADNCKTHGDPNDPLVPVPKGKGKVKEKPVSWKVCPECDELVTPSRNQCPACGYKWPPPVLSDVSVKQKLVQVAWSAMELPVDGWQASPYTSAKGNRMLRLSVRSGPQVISHYWDFAGQGSAYGQRRAVKEWAALRGALPAPLTPEEAHLRFAELKMPSEMTVKQNGNYLNIVRFHG